MTTRRRFIQTAAAAAGLAALGPLGARAGENKKSRVVVVRSDQVLAQDGTPDKRTLIQMLHDGVSALFDVKNPGAAWKRLFKARETVGIKSNEWDKLPTPPELEQALIFCLGQVGVEQSRISVADRSVLRDPIFRKADALLNVRPMRTHAWAGVGSLIKNYIMFVPRPSEYHDDACADLGAIWNLPKIKGKTRLNVLVMLTPLFHGSGWHHFDPKYTWPYKGLVISTDPVAADATGLRILEAKRRQHFGAPRALEPEPKHIRLAGERHGLGEWRTERIEVLHLGPEKGRLI